MASRSLFCEGDFRLAGGKMQEIQAAGENPSGFLWGFSKLSSVSLTILIKELMECKFFANMFDIKAFSYTISLL